MAVQGVPYVHLSSFSLSQSLTRCASFTAAFTRTPLVMRQPGWLPSHFPFLIPMQYNSFPWEASCGNGLSSVPFWCSEWFESAHPELPVQSNSAEVNGNLLQRIQCVQGSYSRLTPWKWEHNWPSCSASLGSEGLIRLNIKKKMSDEGSYLALKKQQKFWSGYVAEDKEQR